MQTRKLLNLQALRFVAAALVVHTHAIDLSQRLGAPDRLTGFGTIENFGAFGVDIFFVISGFIIARTAFQGPRPSAASFAWKRLWRVAPIYFLLSAPWLLFAAEWKTLDGPMLAATFLFWPAAGEAIAYPALMVGWTLMFEMLFYACVALALLARARWTPWALLGGYALCWGLRVTTGAPAFHFLGNPIILEFLMGFALAWIAPRLSHREGVCALTLGLFGVGANLLLGFGPIHDASATVAGGAGLMRVLCWGVPAALIVLGAIAIEAPAAPSRGKRLAVFLGDASYAIYLTHPLAHYWIEKSFRENGILPPGPAITVLGIASALAGGVLVYRYLERPIARLDIPAWVRGMGAWTTTSVLAALQRRRSS
jgi:exopolysaccharide production protein ExoZ